MFAASKTASVSGGYQISRSLRFNSADSAYLNRTPASAGNRRTWTWSAWVKRSTLGYKNLFGCGETINVSNNQLFQFAFDASDRLYLFQYNAPTTDLELITTSVYRDVSAWYHLVLTYDTTQATASNRIKVYVNNQQVGFTGSGYPTQNSDGYVNTAIPHLLGRYSGAGPTLYLDAYMTEVNFIDGQALTPSSFGETNAQTGVWQPKAYSGSYGTNGFYLNFSDNSNTTAATLGKDYSGNGNNWTPNNFSVTAGAGNDSLVDSPTSYGTDTGVGGTVRGNYATWNPLDKNNGSGVLSNGNLDATDTNSSGTSTGVRSTLGGASGKWYFEATLTSGSNAMVGVSNLNAPLASAGWGSLNAWTYYQTTGNKYGNGSDGAYGATYTTNDVIGVAFDSDAGTITFYKNGASQGTAFTGLTGKTLAPYFGTASGTSGFTLNAGQRPFAYTAPSGFKALCTQNLPTPTIGATTATQAGKYFNPVIYTGNGGTQSVTGVGFQPDFVWLKNRTNANAHALEDVIRGAGYTLASSETSAEINYSSYFTAFTSDGFNMALGGGTFNGSGSNYVAWNWKANGSGSTNTAGSITSTVSANTTSGFSIVKWTGTNTTGTIGHGLGVAPAFIIQKATGTAATWTIYHASLGATKYLDFSTAAAYTSSLAWNNTAPTSTVVTVDQYANYGTGGQIAYCFAEVAGYSKFGSYTGNGSTDGVFIYTGFRPAYVLIKTTSTANDWCVYDTARSPYNASTVALYPNGSYAEGSLDGIDILSNGFKLRNTTQLNNQSGVNYIFAAFASVPQKFSLAR
jgi:hypothetical protein